MKKYKVLSMLLALSLLSTSVPVDAAFDAGDSSPEVIREMDENEEAALFDDGSSETAEEGSEETEENAELFADSEETVILSDEEALSASAATGIRVDSHTQEEIAAMANRINPDLPNGFEVEPSSGAPYNPGKLDKATVANALNTLNLIRYIAGIPNNVQNNESYEQEIQAAAYVNMLNNALSHYPAKPDGMDDTLYNLAKQGAGSSNISMGRSNLYQAIVNGWMADDSASNISTLGHRRWCLNPGMNDTGFGAAGRYAAMYSMDGAFSNKGYYGVVWPAQNMPIEYFGGYKNEKFPWSISVGTSVNAGSIYVTLKRERDGKVWNFPTSGADGEFYVDNERYGQPGCIIFRPSGIGGYEDGDVFHVEVIGTSEPISYNVNFFSMHQHSGGTATCIKKAVCDICGKEYGTLSSHRYAKYTTKAAYGQDGSEYEKCETCNSVNESTRKIIYAPKTVILSQTSFEYNGQVQKPTVTVKDAENQIIGTEHYTVSYSGACKNPGTYSVTVTFKGDRYAGSMNASFTIKEKSTHKHTWSAWSIKKATPSADGSKTRTCDCGEKETEVISRPKVMELSKTSFEYDGKEHKPTVTVKDAKNEVISAGNYTVTYSTGCKEPGTYKATVTFKGDLYSGSMNASFTIKEKSAHKHTWSAWSIKKATTSADGSKTRTCDCGEKETEVIYRPKTMELSKTSFEYDGKEHKPTVTVKDAENEVISAGNYTVTYSAGCKEPGTYKATVTFKGDLYSGTLSASFTIMKSGQHEHRWGEWTVRSKGSITKNAHDDYSYTIRNGYRTRPCLDCPQTNGETIYGPALPVLAQTSLKYNGKVQRPELTVRDSEGKMIPASNYTVTWSGACIEPGWYVATVTFKGELYEGSCSTKMKINEADHPHPWGAWKIKKATLTTNGSRTRTCPTCGETQTAVICRPYEVILSKELLEYNGSVQKPSVTVKDYNNQVIAPSEYKVTYSGNCKEPGKYRATVTFNGSSYEGKMTADFEIAKHIHKWSDWTIKKATASADGAKTRTCSCGARDTEVISRPSWVAWDKTVIVKGEPLPGFRVITNDNHLAKTIYMASFPEDCNEVGTHRVKISFEGHELYDCEIYSSYTVVDKPQHTHKWSEWKSIQKAETCMLENGNREGHEGYKIRTCSCGAQESESVPAPSSMFIPTREFIYDGKVHHPKVVLRDNEDAIIPPSEYDVTYTGDCKQVGLYDVIVTFHSEFYAGSDSMGFIIQEAPSEQENAKKKVTISMLKDGTKVYAGANKALGAKTNTSASLSYKTSDSKIADVKNGRIYAYKPGTVKITVTAEPKSSAYQKTSKTITVHVIPGKPGTPTVKRSGKYLTVSVKKTKGAAAYQYQYASNSKMTGAKTKNTKSTSYKFSASASKTYYVRVRAYTKVNGKTYYSGWSSVKKAARK